MLLGCPDARDPKERRPRTWSTEDPGIALTEMVDLPQCYAVGNGRVWWREVSGQLLFLQRGQPWLSSLKAHVHLQLARPYGQGLEGNMIID